MQRPPKQKLTIYDCLPSIEAKTGFYLSSRTLSSLKDFLCGFSVGQSYAGSMQCEEPPLGELSAWFWLHHRAPRARAGGWYAAIMDESLNDKLAFDRFFEYLAIYRQRTPESRWHFMLTPAQRKDYTATQKSPSPHRLRLTRYKGEKCWFLHARRHGIGGWYLHTGYISLNQARRHLTKVFGFTMAQLDTAMAATK